MYIYDCKTEHRKNPVGIDAREPRFSWKIKSDYSGVHQSSYRILVSISKGFETVVWDSGVVKSDQSLYIRYEGTELCSSKRYFWKVTVRTDDECADSAVNYFEMGILDPALWKARWIEPEEQVDITVRKPAAYLRKSFQVKDGLIRARIYQSAHGIYHFLINGRGGTKDLFNPGFTSYYHRIQYQTYDITALLEPGENVWAVILGDGWWRGITGGTVPNNFGYKVAFWGQLQLEYEDGSIDVIVSDESFKTSSGAWMATDMKEGEIYDAAKEPLGWTRKGFNDTHWRSVYPAEEAGGLWSLIPSRNVPVREKEQFQGNVFTDKAGNTVIDFGQNIAGIVSMTLRDCERGDVIRIEHGEDMKDGIFSQENLLSPGMKDIGEFQRIIYIAKGADLEQFTPKFSIFGFRYIKITGCRQEIKPEDFTAIAIYSDLEETGEFECSNPLLNKLFNNCKWSQKGNYMDVPTDCPTRERSPWTGDSQIYCATSALLMNVYPFMEKWMQDFSCEQYPNGMIPSTVPNTISPHQAAEVERINQSVDRHSFLATLPGYMYTDPEYGAEYSDGSSGWGDAAVINPWILYVRYGDKQILINQYDSAKAWVEYVIRQAKKRNPVYEKERYYHTYTDGSLDADFIWDIGFHYGEWLEADVNCFADPDFFPNLKKYASPQVATAYYAYSTELLAKMAFVLDKKRDAEKYAQLSQKIKAVYSRYFICEDGSIIEGRQAPNVRVLKFGLYTEEQRLKVISHLVRLIKEQDYHLNTGFLSTAYLLPVLHQYDQTEIAFRLLEQTSSPSWLFNVKNGATTILEDWKGYENHVGSFNHYSYGAVCEFLFEVIGGIKPDSSQPGYKHFILQPVMGGSLTYAAVSFESPYGKIVSAWKRVDGEVGYRFEIPPNTTATVILPAEKRLEEEIVGYGTVSTNGEMIRCTLGSGTYYFGDKISFM